MSRFAPLPAPPYYSVIFAAQLRPSDDPSDYARTAARMVELAQQQDGYLGMESTRDAAGFGITVSYWRDEAAILAWKTRVEHAAARDRGRSHYYSGYTLRVAKVERAYGFGQ